MMVSQIAEIFGLSSYTNRVLKDDDDILRTIRACKALSENFDAIHDNNEDEDEDDGI